MQKQQEERKKGEKKKGRKEEGKKDKPNYAEAAARIYALYPTQTVRPEGNTVSLKSAKKDKDKILRMLTNGEFTEDSLTYAVTRYLSETKKEYLKLFQTHPLQQFTPPGGLGGKNDLHVDLLID